jgi:putative transposase
MVKPAEQRAAVTHVMAEHGTSERHACRLVEVPRGTHRYQPRPDRHGSLRELVRNFAAEHPRWGLRRIWTLVKKEQPTVGRHRVSRIWSEEKLQVKRRLRKRLVRPKMAESPAKRRNQRWAMDFVADRLADGRALRILTVVDVFTRECLALEVDLSLSGERVKRVLEKVVQGRGERPDEIVVDNGPEFVSSTLTKWCAAQQIKLSYIQPGRPMQNGHVESFNGKLRDECLNLHWFVTLAQARAILAAWRRHYNEERPHSSLGNRTPRDFVAGLPFAPKRMDRAERPAGPGDPTGSLALGLDPPTVPRTPAEI